MRSFVLALIALGLFGSPPPAGAHPPRDFQLPEDVWRGFDPKALPLEVKVIRSWQENKLSLDKLFFTGEVIGKKKVRVFALRGAPVHGKNLPGVLHIHGGGQTASLEWVKFWGARGYACVSFDFCGAWEKRVEYTDWGPFPRGNMAKAGGGFPADPDPRSASWYHWALVSRRALTLLADHPAVNPERLGVFGVSVGGTLCWVVAGADPRVKTAVPIYGCGYNVDRRRSGGVLTPETALYKRVLSPEAHAPYIKCPVLFLSATNDFHGPMDNAYEALAAAPALTRQAFTARTNHHVAAEQGADLPLWMDWHLKGGKPWPKSPRLRLGVNASGVPEARLRVDRPAEVGKVQVLYTLGTRLPQARFWRSAAAVKDHGRWTAPLPVADVWDDLAAYATVTYRSGVCLSSNLVKALPGQLGKARATLAWTAEIDDGSSGGENWFYVSGHTDPTISMQYIRSFPGPGKTTAFGPNPAIFVPQMNYAIASHLLADPAHTGREGMRLAFTCRGGFGAGGLDVVLTERDWAPESVRYTANIPQKELLGGWHTFELPLGRFMASRGRSPAQWSVIEKIELRGTTGKGGPIRFTQFRWVPEKSRKKEG
jgi:hypothetical protein